MHGASEFFIFTPFWRETRRGHWSLASALDYRTVTATADTMRRVNGLTQEISFAEPEMLVGSPKT